MADNGPGIAESIRDRLFHPFVSFGKENGTGLGLAVIQKIVQDHGGTIAVERTADNKTVFRMVIPGRVQEASRAATVATVEITSVLQAPQKRAKQNSVSNPGP